MRRRSLLAGAAAALTASLGLGLPRVLLASRRKPVELTVTIAKTGFSPAVLFAGPGDRVEWVNEDDTAHELVARNGSWETGRLEPGERAGMVVISARGGEYYCRLHPHLTGKIRIG